MNLKNPALVPKIPINIFCYSQIFKPLCHFGLETIRRHFIPKKTFFVYFRTRNHRKFLYKKQLKLGETYKSFNKVKKLRGI